MELAYDVVPWQSKTLDDGIDWVAAAAAEVLHLEALNVGDEGERSDSWERPRCQASRHRHSSETTTKMNRSRGLREDMNRTVSPEEGREHLDCSALGRLKTIVYVRRRREKHVSHAGKAL